MEFEWDEAKSEACFEQRGFDFAYALRAFADPNRLISHDHRWDYGEERSQLLGAIEHRIFHVVYTLRAGRIRSDLWYDAGSDDVYATRGEDPHHFGAQSQ